MAKVEGIKGLLTRLKGLLKRSEMERGKHVVVGYTDPSAVFVHENMNPKTLGQHVPRPSGLGEFWGPSQFGPKFLEAPARAEKEHIGRLVRDAVRSGKTPLQAMLLAGLFLQRKSQELVPVEHGDLRRSAYTEVED